MSAGNNDWNELLASLPRGEVQYTRSEDGTWAVAIFSPGSVHLLATVATGMDKSVALWLSHHLHRVIAPNQKK